MHADAAVDIPTSMYGFGWSIFLGLGVQRAPRNVISVHMGHPIRNVVEVKSYTWLYRLAA